MIVPQRPRNEPFDALAELDGVPKGESPSKTEAGRIAKALKIIREITPDVTRAQIEVAASMYRDHWPTVDISSTSLSKHWRKFHVMARERTVNEAKRADLEAEMMSATGDRFVTLQRQLQALEDQCGGKGRGMRG